MWKFNSRMIYVQIPEHQRAKAVLLLVKGGYSMVCLSGKIYGVGEEHLKFLKRRRISFRKLDASKIRIPEPVLA